MSPAPLASVCHHHNHSRCQHHSHIDWWIIVADHNHYRCHQHPPSPRLLLHCSIVMRSSSSFTHFLLTYFSALSPSPPALPPPPPSPSYLHRILLLPCLSFDSSSSSTKPLPSRPSTSHSRLPLPPRSHLFLPPKLTTIYFIVVCFSVVVSSPLPHPMVAIPPTVSAIVINVVVVVHHHLLSSVVVVVVVVMAAAFVVVVIVVFVKSSQLSPLLPQNL